jgi:hypothetical protein
MRMALKIQHNTHTGHPGLAHPSATCCLTTITRTTTTQYQSRGIDRRANRFPVPQRCQCLAGYQFSGAHSKRLIRRGERGPAVMPASRVAGPHVGGLPEVVTDEAPVLPG